jgi:hypothetical protein
MAALLSTPTAGNGSAGARVKVLGLSCGMCMEKASDRCLLPCLRDMFQNLSFGTCRDDVRVIRLLQSGSSLVTG